MEIQPGIPTTPITGATPAPTPVPAPAPTPVGSEAEIFRALSGGATGTARVGGYDQNLLAALGLVPGLGGGGTAQPAGGATQPAPGAQPPAPTSAGTGATGTPGSAAPSTDASTATPTVFPNYGSISPVAGAQANAGTAGTAGGVREVVGVDVAYGGGPMPRRRGVGVRYVGDHKPFAVGVDGARFSFPPISQSDGTGPAPRVTWGPGWHSVRGADGTTRMEHPGGARARSIERVRALVTPAGNHPFVAVDQGGITGRARRLPDGTLIGVAKGRRPFVIRPGQPPEFVGYGTHTVGGAQVRFFRMTIVNVHTKDGRDLSFDSRGGIRRWRGPGSDAVAGGGSGGATGGVDQIGGGPALAGGDLQQLLERMTKITRDLMGQLEDGGAPAELGDVAGLLDGLSGALGQGLGGALLGTGVNLASLDLGSLDGATDGAGAVDDAGAAAGTDEHAHHDPAWRLT